MASASTSRSKVHPGVQFRAVIADCNALWQVVGKEGRDSWMCVVVPEPEPVEVGGVLFEGEYVGHRQVFTGAQIRRTLSMAAFFAESADRAQVAWESVKVGDTVHYNQGHGEFYRCEVV